MNKKLIILLVISILIIIGVAVFKKYFEKETKITKNLIEVKNNIPESYYDISLSPKEKEAKVKEKKAKEKAKKEAKLHQEKQIQKETNTKSIATVKPIKKTFKFTQIEEVNKEEIKRQNILSALTNASFSGNLKTTDKGDFYDAEDYELKIKKELDLYLRTEDFGKSVKKNQASKRVNLSRTLTADKLISIILITAINSHLKGKILAMVENNVYASHGADILIPKGSKAIGWYKPLKKLGDERLGITWTRVITPAGVNINLKASSADVMGRSGAMGDLDNRYFMRYGLALTISTVTNGISYAALKSTKSEDDADATDEDIAKNQIIKDYKADITSITEQILNDQLQIKPTINIEAGTRLFMFPVSDIWFPQAENNNIDVSLVNKLKSKKGEN